MTHLFDLLKNTYKKINSNKFNCEEIKEAISLLKKLGYDIYPESSILKFYELLLGKEDSLKFLKEYKDNNIEIRYLNEFIEESEGCMLLTSDIDNLLDAYTFFNKLINDNDIQNDEILLNKLKKEFDKNANIINKICQYLNIYGEIYKLYQSYHGNLETIIEKIRRILFDSIIKIYKDTDKGKCSLKLKNKKINGDWVSVEIKELEKLKNKILIFNPKNIIVNK